jgi:hypothetical protein
MKFLLSVILIALLSAFAESFLPWWSIAIVSFLVSLLSGMRPGKSLLAGVLGIVGFWLVVLLFRDISNDHILSQRIAAVFSLPHYSFFIAVTVFIGSLVGGLAALSGSLLRYRRPGKNLSGV